MGRLARSGPRESFAYAGKSVDRGYSILVYPEGVRTSDGKPSPFRSGVGMLAARLNLPVVPIRIDGLYEMKMAGHKVALPGELTIVIGKPLRFPSETPARRNHQPNRACHVDYVTGNGPVSELVATRPNVALLA